MLESLSARLSRSSCTSRPVRNRIRVFGHVWSAEKTSWRALDARKGPTQKSLAGNGFVRPRLHPFSRLYIVTIHRSYNPADLPDGKPSLLGNEDVSLG